MNFFRFAVPRSHCARPAFCPGKTTWWSLSCLAAGVPGVMAQDVLLTPAVAPLQPSAVQQYQTNRLAQMQVFVPEETAPPAPLETPIQWGSLAVRPHLLYQFLYGNGIQSSPGQHQNTIVQELSPGVLFDLGACWTLDYTPALTFYSSSNFRDTVDESVRLSWGTTYNDWFFAGSQSYASSSDPEVDTAAQTDREYYVTVLKGTCQFNQKMSLDLEASQNLNYVGNAGATNYLLSLASSRVWSTMNWLNYQFRPRLSAGLGLGLGYNQTDHSPASIDEQYQGRLDWRATDKVSIELSGGLEDMQYLSGGAGSLATPICGAAIQYQPFNETQISLNAGRTVSTSPFQDQVTEVTQVAIELNQRLLGRLHLDLIGSWSSTEYVVSLAGLSTGRNDDLYSFHAALTCPFFKRGTFKVLYQFTENSSSQTGFAVGKSAFGYSSNQIGCEIGYRF
jgi:hypothetical protein